MKILLVLVFAVSCNFKMKEPEVIDSTWRDPQSVHTPEEQGPSDDFIHEEDLPEVEAPQVDPSTNEPTAPEPTPAEVVIYPLPAPPSEPVIEIPVFVEPEAPAPSPVIPEAPQPNPAPPVVTEPEPVIPPVQPSTQEPDPVVETPVEETPPPQEEPSEPEVTQPEPEAPIPQPPAPVVVTPPVQEEPPVEPQDSCANDFPAGIKMSGGVVQDWGSGYKYEFTLKNEGVIPVAAWTMCFYYEHNVSGPWNATISGTEPNWRITPMSYNKLLNPTQSVSVGWVSSPGGVNGQVIKGVKFIPSENATCPVITPNYCD